MITKVLGNVPVIKVLDFLREHMPMDYPMNVIEDRTNVGHTALRRDFDNLLQNKMIVETRRIAGVPLYALNRSNRVVTAIMRFCNEISVREDPEVSVEDVREGQTIVFPDGDSEEEEVPENINMNEAETVQLPPEEDIALEYGSDVISETESDADDDGDDVL